MSKLRKKIGEAGQIALELQPERDLALLRAYDNAVRVIEEELPKYRAEQWEKLSARREAVAKETSEVHEAIQGTKDLISHAQARLASLKGTGGAEAVGAAAEELETLRARLTTLNERQQVLLAEEREELQVASTWTGTKEAFREALLSPDVLVDRRWARLQLAGPWRDLADGAEIGVKFQLESGAAVDWWPRR